MLKGDAEGGKEMKKRENAKEVRALSYNYASSSPEARGSSC